MADRQLSSIPWTALAVVVAFVSSTLLVPRAFEPLRPAEKERAQPAPDAELEVDARLWEDPFSAMRRAEAERQTLCDKPRGAMPGADCDATAIARKRAPAELMARLAGAGALDNTLFIAALVPGNPFVGAEESRRRTRYAVLAGLQARGYVSDNAERIGLLEFGLPASRALAVPFELLATRTLPGALAQAGAASAPAPAAPYAHVVLLWIDETALPAPKLDTMARLLALLFAGREARTPPLALIGPSSSDALRVALADLDRAAALCAPAGDPDCRAMDRQVHAGYRHLARARIFSAAATASTLALPGLDGRPLEAVVSERLQRIDGPGGAAPLALRRTSGSDDVVLARLVQELQLRLPPPLRRRVVLLAERDSIYAQALVDELQRRVPMRPGLRVEVSYFFRGIDGITARDTGSAADKSAGAKGGAPAAANAVAVEWPESRDQLDYLRRVAGALEASEGEDYSTPIGAIGILASDVHDKLLLLQALHERFADKVFFTTDMDARFLHPRALPFTRNLIVASSLPLELPPLLQAGTPPLRDATQAATFLAAQLASCRGPVCRTADALMQRMLDSPSVYEIGRSRAVPINGWDHAWRNTWTNTGRAALAAPLMLLVLLGLTVWPSTPSLRQVRAALLHRRVRLFEGAALQWPVVALVVAHAGWLAYALGAAIEFVEPGRIGLRGVVWLAALAGIGVLVLMLGTLHVEGLPAWSPRRVGPASKALVWLKVLGAGLAVAALSALIWPSGRSAVCIDCEPVAWLQGVSAWPSLALLLAALLAVVVALDRSWAAALRSVREDARWLGLAGPAAAPAAGLAGASAPALGRGALRTATRVRLWLRHNSLAYWPAGGRSAVRFADLWWHYTQRGRPVARVVRVLWWYALTLAIVGSAFVGFSQGYVPEVPVRGADHRRLVAFTLYACVLLLPLLMVAVADATQLACRFIGHLNRGRSVYPPAVLEHFSQALGGEHAALWCTPLAADPARRSAVAPGAVSRGAVHSLLDDWIDVQLVARRTAVVAPLIVGPLVVVALLLVARSRLFDAWALTPPIALAFSGYLVWLVLLALLLKRSAERTREHSLRHMNADLLWLAGAGPEWARLVEPMKRLIAAVGDERRGAFAGLFDQPLFTGLLVPLGGAGGAQLFDYLLLAR